MFGIDDMLIAGGLSAAASFLGGERRNAAQADQAASANAFSAQQFATRYQTTVKDMQAAGLSPMLAYSQGGGAPPSGQQAAMSDTMTPAVDAGRSAYMAKAQADVLRAQVENVEADTLTKRASAGLIEAQTGAAGASADQSRSQINVNEANFAKIVAETKNLPKEGDRLDQTVEMLAAQANLMREQGLTQGAIRASTAATIQKLIRETSLLDLDISAANALDNLGRSSKQLEPIVSIIRSLIKR